MNRHEGFVLPALNCGDLAWFKVQSPDPEDERGTCPWKERTIQEILRRLIQR